MKPLTRVHEWRERRMLTQKELAKRAGVSLFTVQRIESGRGGAHPGTGRKIAQALDVAFEDLWDETTPRARVSRSSKEWLDEHVGHSYLAMSDEESRAEQKKLKTVAEVEALRADLRDEYDVAREALDSQELTPQLRNELLKAKTTLVQWHLELTKIVNRLPREQSLTSADEEIADHEQL
jgi:DNA-binding XRE family transcriptional regulator